MTNDKNWPKVAVVGAGAVGGYFGGLLARSGVPVTMIGRPAFVEAVLQKGLLLDTKQFQETVHPAASTELSATAGADIVLFCVKTTDTASVSKELAKYISSSAVVLSMQNGVNNAEEIRKASGIEAISTVVYVAASAPSPGTVQHLGRGDLVIGPHSPNVDKTAEFFSRAKLPCRVSDNIEGELWTKLVWNCALNAVSGLGRVTYGEIIASEDAKRVVEAVVYEVLAVAKRQGIDPPGLEDPKAAIAGALLIGKQMSGTRSSTAQDMARNKRTEIESLNGHIARLGAELGVPVPVNHTLYTLVKLQEANF
ncbi:MAG TPA: ketopantoate reductase family protein [Candidatus Limnocylindrales bacterium]|nr:ketopantoate reductase family protein [Candidatus Limnocylindrales bacterium]